MTISQAVGFPNLEPSDYKDDVKALYELSYVGSLGLDAKLECKGGLGDDCWTRGSVASPGARRAAKVSFLIKLPTGGDGGGDVDFEKIAAAAQTASEQPAGDLAAAFEKQMTAVKATDDKYKDIPVPEAKNIVVSKAEVYTKTVTITKDAPVSVTPSPTEVSASSSNLPSIVLAVVVCTAALKY